ncbi:MAG: STAS domain-containing protein [Anaerovoracaceae bacterium]|jgi:stage II sporulation protein AA (anti-sigma F factor antagonist)
MGITFEMIEDILIAFLSGELDHHSSGKVREIIDQTFDTFQAKHLILSFREITFMDSAGVGVVIGRFNKVKKRNGLLAVVDCNDYINRIFEMAAIYTIASYFPTVEEGVEFFKVKGEEGELWNTSIR